jgi:hypothetical protein
MRQGIAFVCLTLGLLMSGCADFNYRLHRTLSGLDCRPEVIRQHNGQCQPVTAAKTTP